MRRQLWIALGCTSVALGAAGVVLPLLPTTPFVLLAAWAFAKSSPRLHDWLLAHNMFGPLIADWRRNGAIAPRAKVASVLAMAAAFGLSLALAAPAWLLAVQGAVLAASAAFVLSRPGR
ncbi:hypothetical protein IP88_09735 [alpha proteobacterium AAP81b]|nr:hypothetical protein IP88_09735 [alpha proteobacterium AAP81b]